MTHRYSLKNEDIIAPIAIQKNNAYFSVNTDRVRERVAVRSPFQEVILNCSHDVKLTLKTHKKKRLFH